MTHPSPVSPPVQASRGAGALAPEVDPSSMRADAGGHDEAEAPASWRPPPLKAGPYPEMLSHAMVQAGRVRCFLWDRALRDLKATQLKQLAGIVQRGAATEFGRAHAMGEATRFETTLYEEFRARVPVGDYDSHAPYIDRMRAGEKNLLVPEFVLHFGNSSGSSVQGKSKFLPISDKQIHLQQEAGKDGVLRYAAKTHDTSLMGGFTLGLFPPITMRQDGPVRVTSNPALMATKMPALSRPVYLPDDSVRAIPDYNDKLDVIARRYLDHDVRALSGTTCWFGVLFDKLLREAERRGRRVRHVRDIWPNLRVLFGGGVSADPYMPLLRELLGPTPFYLVDTYNATEGGIYASSDFSGERGLLMLPHRGTFFEFIPLEEADAPRPTRVPLWEVETDRLYAIVVSTVSGMYAYKLGDIVRFSTVWPHRIEFAGRLTGCLSVTQELTTHVEIERAVAFAASKVPCTPVDFGAAADVGVGSSRKSRYVLFAEFKEGAEPADLDAFARAFDEGMCKENRVYREHRDNDVAILLPRVERLVTGGAARFLGHVTNGNVQGKFPRILNESRREALTPFLARSEAN